MNRNRITEYYVYGQNPAPDKKQLALGWLAFLDALEKVDPQLKSNVQCTFARALAREVLKRLKGKK